MPTILFHSVFSLHHGDVRIENRLGSPREDGVEEAVSQGQGYLNLSLPSCNFQVFSHQLRNNEVAHDSGRLSPVAGAPLGAIAHCWPDANLEPQARLPDLS